MQSLTVPNEPHGRLASSVGRALERQFKGCGLKPHVRLTLYLELKNLDTVMNIMYIGKQYRTASQFIINLKVKQLKKAKC